MKKLSLVTLSTLCTLCVHVQTLQSVTDNGNSTTKNIWVGSAPLAGLSIVFQDNYALQTLYH